MQFHHMGLATRDPLKTISFLRVLGYQVGEVVFDKLQGVNLIMCTSITQPNIELVFPNNGPSPVDKILESNRELIYHCCYEVDNIENTILILKENKIRSLMISPPTPAILFGGKKVAFYRVDGFGIIELLEKI